MYRPSNRPEGSMPTGGVSSDSYEILRGGATLSKEMSNGCSCGLHQSLYALGCERCMQPDGHLAISRRHGAENDAQVRCSTVGEVIGAQAVRRRMLRGLGYKASLATADIPA